MTERSPLERASPGRETAYSWRISHRLREPPPAGKPPTDGNFAPLERATPGRETGYCWKISHRLQLENFAPLESHPRPGNRLELENFAQLERATPILETAYSWKILHCVREPPAA